MRTDNGFIAAIAPQFAARGREGSNSRWKDTETMNWVPVIWSLWGVSVLLMAAVSIYASRLAKDEEDQLFLADSSSHAQTEQADIASKVGKLEPLKKAAMALLAVMTLLVVVFYLFDFVRQFR